MCGVIRFLYTKNKNLTEIHCKIVAVYKCMINRKQVSVWRCAFIEERKNLQDDPYVRCSYSLTTEDYIPGVEPLSSPIFFLARGL